MNEGENNIWQTVAWIFVWIYSFCQQQNSELYRHGFRCPFSWQQGRDEGHTGTAELRSPDASQRCPDDPQSFHQGPSAANTRCSLHGTRPQRPWASYCSPWRGRSPGSGPLSPHTGPGGHVLVGRVPCCVTLHHSAPPTFAVWRGRWIWPAYFGHHCRHTDAQICRRECPWRPSAAFLVVRVMFGQLAFKVLYVPVI